MDDFNDVKYINYEIVKQQFSLAKLIINTPENIDYRDDKELMKQLAYFHNVKYTYPHPLEWLPSHIIYFNYCDIFEIDYKYKKVSILDNIDSGYDEIEDSKRYSSNDVLLAMMQKYKRVICYANVALDWLPDGITHLEIDNQMFNQPLDNLPQSLILLSICGGKQVFNERIFKQSLDYLPVGLKCLHLANLEAEIPLNNLPITLEYLFIEQREYTLPLENLPISIKKVIVITDTNCINNKD